MADEELSFLEETPEVEEVEAEAPEQPEPEKAEAEAEGTGEVEEPETPEPEQAAPPVAEKESAGQVPLSVVLDERERRQKAEQQVAELKKWREQQEREAAQREAQKKAPDWFEDPQAAAQFQAQSIQRQVLNTHLNQSQFLAEREFGKEIVGETEAFVRQNPHVIAQVRNHPSPWHAAVEVYQRHKAIEEIGTDPEAYKAKLREEIQAEILNQAPVQQKTKAPPPSMASAPSAGKGDAISPGNTFDEMFSS